MVTNKLNVLHKGFSSVLTSILKIMIAQNLVIRTKSVEYMPYYLSLATFLMSMAFFAYGMLKHDAFVSVSPC